MSETAEAPARTEDLPAFKSSYGKLPAQDVERARAFWRDKLGFEPVRENHGHLFYECGGASFLIFPSSGSPSGTHDQLGFVVDDVRDTVEKLRACGVVFEQYEPRPGVTFENDVMDMGTVKAAWFKDSEGNLISVAQFGG
jgi:catechol 2,3-dioxygenase-like lactoylglutathione lyase family enzyme